MKILDSDLASTPLFAQLLAERPEVRRTLTTQIQVPEVLAPPVMVNVSSVDFESTDESDVIKVMPLPQREPGVSLRQQADETPDWFRAASA